MTADRPASSPVHRAIARLRSGAAPIAKSALLHGGGYAAVRRAMPSTRLAILRYHAVCDPDGYAYADPGICISPAAFASHIAYLAANYSVLDLPDAVARLRAGAPLPPNAVAITFDDGYADNLPAARVLDQHGLPATFFITSGCIGEAEPFWPAEIRMLIPLIPDPEVALTADGLRFIVLLHGPEDRAAAVPQLTRLLKSQPIPVRDAIRDQLRAAAGRPALPGCMLGWDELAEMCRLGMTIGAHTMTHPNLPSAGLAAATIEIAGSKARLEQELGVPVTTFSYPNGGAERYYTSDIQRAVADAGFIASASSRNGFASSASDLYALERIEVQERLEDLVFALEVERFAFAPRR